MGFTIPQHGKHCIPVRNSDVRYILEIIRFPQYKMVNNIFFCIFKSRNVNPAAWIIFFNIITINMYMLVLTFHFINDDSESLIKNIVHKYEPYIEVSEIFYKGALFL